jgi:hypothetical protein
MKPRGISLSVLSAFFVLLVSVSTSSAQSPFEVPLRVTDGVWVDTLYFGILPSANFCIVETDGFNGHFEFFLPPGPPVSFFDARFSWPRSGMNSACFEQGSPNDFRPFTRTAQKDTFRVRAQMGSGTIMFFSWPASLSSYFSQLTLRYFDGTANVYVNMLTDTSVDMTTAGDLAIASIFAVGLYGPEPYFGLNPASLAFGNIPFGSRATLPVTVTNNGLQDTLSVSGVTTPLEYSVTPNPPGPFPIRLYPGESRGFDVTFAPSVVGLFNGNVVFTHNAPGGLTSLPVTGRGVCAPPTQRARVVVGDSFGLIATLWFGFHPNATLGIDPDLCELEIPPIPPVGAPDARFVNPPGCTGLGQGVFNDYRRYVSSTAIDTHLVRFQPFVGPGYPVTLRWTHSEVQTICDSAVFIDPTGSVPRTRMDLRDSVVVSDDQVDRLLLYLYGQQLDETGVVQTSPGIPEACVLFQNFPNPFNPSTTIKFSLPKSGHVTLKVYDLLGRETATLVSEHLSAGTYERMFSSEGFPSGVYFYRLQTDGFVQTRKLLLLR